MVRRLANTDDQTFWIQIGAQSYTIRLYSFRSLMYADVKTGNDYLICGVRIFPNTWILPGILGKSVGNFRFETYHDDQYQYPEYVGFNDKFRLCYYSEDEIAAMEE